MQVHAYLLLVGRRELLSRRARTYADDDLIQGLQQQVLIFRVHCLHKQFPSSVGARYCGSTPGKEGSILKETTSAKKFAHLFLDLPNDEWQVCVEVSNGNATQSQGRCSLDVLRVARKGRNQGLLHLGEVLQTGLPPNPANVEQGQATHIVCTRRCLHNRAHPGSVHPRGLPHERSTMLESTRAGISCD